jgi:hypothetical protein
MATQLKKRKHNLRKQNFKQGKVDKRRFDKYNESIKGVDSIANRVQILKDTMTGQEYKALTEVLKTVLINFLSVNHDSKAIRYEDYTPYLEDANKIYDLIAIDDIFVTFLNAQLAKEGIISYE